MYFRRDARDTSALSPALGVVLLVIVTLFLAILIAPLVYNMAHVEEKPEGVEVTFEESQNGSVDVRIVDMGTADTLYVHTDYLQREVTDPGDTVPVYPGEGDITIIAAQEGVKTVAQTYQPKWGPDEPLAAIVDGDLRKQPGSTYSLSASDSLGDITSYRWDFDGDGDIEATGQYASPRWTRPGIYNVSLTVEDEAGNTHTSTEQITNTHLVVAQDGTGDYEKIQWAVDNASSGWSIYVKATGQYEERVELDRAGLTVFSDEYATIDGEFISGTDAGVSITDDSVEFRGMRVRGFTNGPAVTVTSYSDDVVLDDIYVDESGNDGQYGGAVYIQRNADDTTISNSRILSNDGTCAVVLGTDYEDFGGPYVSIENTAIRSNSQNGLCAYDSVMRLDLTNSDFAYNGEHGAYLGDGDDITVRDTVFRRNGISEASDDAAVFVHYSQDMVLDGLTVVDNADSGLNTDASPRRLTIQHSRFERNGDHGLILNEVEDSHVTNVTSRWNTGIGLLLTGTTQDLNVDQSRLNANARNGLSLTNQVHEVDVTETDVMRNTEHGVYLDRADSIYFGEGNFTQNGGSSGEYHGVYIRGTSWNDANNIVVRHSHLYGTNQSEEDIVAHNSAKDVDARYNWWGANAEPTTDQYSGDIDWVPICADEDCTSVR